MRVFAFIDLDFLPSTLAVARGSMVSVDNVRDAGAGFISFMTAGMLNSGANYRIHNESIFEAIRRVKYAHQPSRIRGLYFFENERTAVERIGDDQWPHFFKTENLFELELREITALARLDSNFITYSPLDCRCRLSIEEGSNYVERYWSGEAMLDEPVWEILAHCKAVFLDLGRRRSVYEELESDFPQWGFDLLLARIATEVGTQGGLVTPVLLDAEDDKIELQYLWRDAEFHDIAAIELMRHHPDFGKLRYFLDNADNFRKLDLRGYGRTFQLGEQKSNVLNGIKLPSVHF